MKTKKALHFTAFDAVNYSLLFLVTVICLYPIYYTIIASFSDYVAVSTGQVILYPVGFQLEAYQHVFENSEIWNGYKNTFIYTIGGTLFNLILTIPTAYALSKKKMYARDAISWYFLFTMYFGGGMIPAYILNRNLGLIDNPLIMIISGGISIYNVVVTRTYFNSSIPESLYEAGRIDGSSEFGLFFKVALPLSMPIIAVMSLYYAVGHWNGYFTAMIYLTTNTYHPLALVLRRILILNENALSIAEEAGVDVNLLEQMQKRVNLAVVMKYALVLVASAPMLIMYPFIQRYFVKGVMIGSLKG